MKRNLRDLKQLDTTLAREAIIDLMVNLLAERSQVLCEEQGGYPDDVARVGAYVVAATIDQDEPVLEIHSNAKIVRWYRAAAGYLRQNDDATDVFEALNETEPADPQEEEPAAE